MFAETSRACSPFNQSNQNLSPKSNHACGRSRQPRRRLVIYQRNHDRRILELDDNVAVFRELLGAEWEVVPIVHDNAHEPCWLYSQLMDADMLLTPHG